mmetsp:Transcript_41831/g.119642  ORF Transcript_41831/g.119642 Transcript_41831/m.119642 type:complete len:105 (+) Transcript_41831:121-435(+)
MRVVLPNKVLKQLSNTSFPTCASIADSGSSKTMMSALLYAARAMATRCFCPPEIVIPRSPISVKSPAVNCLMSSSNEHAFKTCAYQFSSISEPNKMFSLTVSRI